MYKVLTALVAITLCIPAGAHAQSVLRAGDGITVASEQVVEGDYYVSVGPIGTTVMSGTVTHDMYAFGGTVTANGTIGEDLGIIGGVAHMHASVTDDVRIVAGETIVAEHIGGDLFVLSGLLRVLPTAKIDGDIIFYGGEAEINGEVGGSIYGSASTMRIDAPVGGNVDVTTANDLTLGGRAVIAGDVTYATLSQLQRAQEAVIEGTISEKAYDTDVAQDGVKTALMPTFVLLFATLSLYLLFRKRLEELVIETDRSYLKSGLVGLAVVILGPLLSLLLMVTLLGVIAGLLGFALTLLVYITGAVVMSVIVGSSLSKLVVKKTTVSLTWILAGAVAIHILLYIPVVGPMILFALFCISVGAVSLKLYSALI